MIKTSLVALATAAALVGVSAPAMADTSTDENSYLWDAQVAQIELRQNGVNASGVDEWNGLWRAFVVHEDGSQSMQFFDKTSLSPVAL